MASAKTSAIAGHLRRKPRDQRITGAQLLPHSISLVARTHGHQICHNSASWLNTGYPLWQLQYLPKVLWYCEKIINTELPSKLLIYDLELRQSITTAIPTSNFEPWDFKAERGEEQGSNSLQVPTATQASGERGQGLTPQHGAHQRHHHESFFAQ